MKCMHFCMLVVLFSYVACTSNNEARAEAGVGETVKFLEPCLNIEVIGKVVQWTTGARAHPIVFYNEKLYELEGSYADPMGWDCDCKIYPTAVECPHE